MSVGKNKPCPCGSGKKYKVCCMEKDIVKIKEFKFQQPTLNNSQNRLTHKLIHEYTFESIFKEEVSIPNHPIPKGLRSFCLYRIEQILRELNKSEPNDRLLKAFYGELYWLFYKNISQLENKINDIKKASNSEEFMEFENEGLTNIEQQIVLENTVSASLLDYAYNTLDYGAFKIVASFCKEMLLQGLSDDVSIGLVRLQIDTGDELVGWEFVESKSTSSEIIYEYVSMDVLDNEYQKMKLRLNGFSDLSLKTIATAITQEDALKKSKDLISYTGLAMNYFGLLEQELRNIVYKHNKSFTNKRMMWRDLTQFYKENTLPILSKFLPEFGRELAEFNGMRNKSAHGEFISFEEFNKLKTFVFKHRVFEYMSWELKGEIPKIKQMGFIESDVIYGKGELQPDIESFNKSVNELGIIEKDVDVLVNTKEPSMQPGMKHFLELIIKGEAVLVSDFDGGKILFEKIENGEYRATKFNSSAFEDDRRSFPVGSKKIKHNELVKMFEKGAFISPK